MKQILSMVMVLTAAASAAQAQTLRATHQMPPPVGTGDYPRHEIGLNLGLWQFDEGYEFWGLRWGRRVRGPIAVEASFDKHSGDSAHMQYRLFIANARFLKRPGDRPVRLFATGGVARGHGLTQYGWSPVVGFGGQSNWEARIAVRVDVQIFTRAPKQSAERSRLLFGFSIGL